MQIFISWSGVHSKAVAEALRDWLPMVIQAVRPWISSADIEKGETWFSSIQKSLQDAKGMGIFCLTQQNLVAPWLAFEAGVLSAQDRARVATFLHQVDNSAVKPPLSLFQSTRADDQDDVFKLLQSINARLEQPLGPAILKRSFDQTWDDFERTLDQIHASSSAETTAVPSTEAMLQEVLGTVRRLERLASGISEADEARLAVNSQRLVDDAAVLAARYEQMKSRVDHKIDPRLIKNLQSSASNPEDYAAIIKKFGQPKL